MEGKVFVEFKGKKIAAAEAKDNYEYWQAKEDIPKLFTGAHETTLTEVRKVRGAHTFAFKANSDSGVIYPLLKIFSYNEKTGRFDGKNPGLICDRIRKGDGKHMSLARELGLDKFVFSYVGMHLPYHRKDDSPPIFPFGLFVKPDAFARMHGSPCDRDYDNNDRVDENDIEKYFLLPDDLQKLLTDRILKDPFFGGDFWKYYGNHLDWEDENYRNEHWKRKGEYCHFEKISPEDIEAVLWPVWEGDVEDESFSPGPLFELMSVFKDAFNIKVIIYRPYGDIIDRGTWLSRNMRDWEISLVEASYLAHRYYNEQNNFPDSIKAAKEYFKNSTI